MWKRVEIVSFNTKPRKGRQTLYSCTVREVRGSEAGRQWNAFLTTKSLEVCEKKAYDILSDWNNPKSPFYYFRHEDNPISFPCGS